MILFFGTQEAKPATRRRSGKAAPVSLKTEALLRASGQWSGNDVTWNVGPVDPGLTPAEVQALADKHGSPHFNKARAVAVKNLIAEGRSLPEIKSRLSRPKRHGYGARQIEKDHAALLSVRPFR